jgi:Domain of unknown function (DUF4116)
MALLGNLPVTVPCMHCFTLLVESEVGAASFCLLLSWSFLVLLSWSFLVFSLLVCVGLFIQHSYLNVYIAKLYRINFLFPFKPPLLPPRDLVVWGFFCNGQGLSLLALQYASKDLKKDREIVLGAVKNDSLALQYGNLTRPSQHPTKGTLPLICLTRPPMIPIQLLPLYLQS